MVLSKSRLTTIAFALFLLGASGSARYLYSQETQNRGRQNAAPGAGNENQKSKAGDLELLRVQGNVSMLAGAGGNITVQAGPQGIVLVDTGAAAMADKVVAAIRPLSKNQLTYIINTDDRL